MREEIIYEITLGKSGSDIIEWKQIEFMVKVFELAKESKLIEKESEIVKIK